MYLKIKVCLQFSPPFLVSWEANLRHGINQTSLSSGFWLGLANSRHWLETRRWAGREKTGHFLSWLSPCSATVDCVRHDPYFRSTARDPSSCWTAVLHSLLLFLALGSFHLPLSGFPKPCPYFSKQSLHHSLQMPPFFLLEPHWYHHHQSIYYVPATVPEQLTGISLFYPYHNSVVYMTIVILF